MSHSITTENQIKPLDIDYRDPRGVIVHVTGWNRDKQQVYFTRQNYPHECMQPVWKFQQYFYKGLGGAKCVITERCRLSFG